MRVVADPTRVRLLQFLDEGDASVQELADRLGVAHQTVSKHLGLLHRAGMLSRSRDGTSTRYSLVDWTGWWMVEQIASTID